MTRLLVIDDDRSLTNRVSGALRWRGHEVVDADAPEKGRSLALEELPRPELIMLSVALSRSTNPPLLPALRRGGYRGPIIVWHRSRNESDIVLSFRQGADQYVPIPFGMRELFARVDASIARSAARTMPNASTASFDASARQGMYAFGGIEVDMVAREVSRRGEAVNLSPLEFDLLVALLRREGAATTRTELLREVWNYGPGVVSRTLDTHILNLRAKLEDEPRAPRHILTVRKIGYRLDI